MLEPSHIEPAPERTEPTPAWIAARLWQLRYVKDARASTRTLRVTEAPDAVACQFGKVGKNEFTLDYAWPLTPLQAFGFALTSLAYKLANEGG